MELTQQQRNRRQSRALVGAFLAAYMLSGGMVHRILTLDTVFTLLADLALAVSLPGNAGVLALTHVLILALGLVFLNIAFATFASYGGNLLLSTMGVAGIAFASGIMAGSEGVVVLAALLFLQAFLHHRLDYRADYKNMLMLNTLMLLALMLLSLNASIVRHGGALTVEALRKGLTVYAGELSGHYTATAAALAEQGMQTVPNILPPLRVDQAVLYVINNLPAILGVAAMICAFFFTSWFRRASGRQLPKLGLVLDEFEISQIGAAFYVGISLVAFFGGGIIGSAALQCTTVMTLPLSIQGLTSIRRNTKATGRGLPLIVILLLLFTATPTSILMFFALCGALDRILPKRKPEEGGGE